MGARSYSRRRMRKGETGSRAIGRSVTRTASTDSSHRSARVDTGKREAKPRSTLFSRERPSALSEYRGTWHTGLAATRTACRRKGGCREVRLLVPLPFLMRRVRSGPGS